MLLQQCLHSKAFCRDIAVEAYCDQPCIRNMLLQQCLHSKAFCRELAEIISRRQLCTQDDTHTNPKQDHLSLVGRTFIMPSTTSHRIVRRVTRHSAGMVCTTSGWPCLLTTPQGVPTLGDHSKTQVEAAQATNKFLASQGTATTSEAAMVTQETSGDLRRSQDLHPINQMDDTSVTDPGIKSNPVNEANPDEANPVSEANQVNKANQAKQ